MADRDPPLLIASAMPAAVRTALVSSSPLVLAGLKVGLEQRGDFEIVFAREGPLPVADTSLGQAQVGVIDIANDADLQPLALIAAEAPPLLLLWPDRDGPLAEWLGGGCSLLPRDAPIELIAAAAHAAAVGLVASAPELALEALRSASGPDRRT